MKRFFIGFLAVIGALAILAGLAAIFVGLISMAGTERVPGTMILELDLEAYTIEYVPDDAMSQAMLSDATVIRDFTDALLRAKDDRRVVGVFARLGTGKMGLAQIQEMRFPVFTSGSICSHGYCQVVDVNVTVHVGGVTVQPGDLLHGDCNGVTTIPKEIAGEVSRLCTPFAAIEAELMRSIQSSGRDLQAVCRAREKSFSQTQELKKRLQAGKLG